MKTILTAGLAFWSAIAAAQPAVDPAFDNACVNAAAALISKTEAAHPADMIRWIAVCNQHPIKQECEDTSNMIATFTNTNATPLTCNGAAQTPDVSASSLAQAKEALARFESASALVASAKKSPTQLADDACANLTASLNSNTEVARQADVIQWIAACNGHPNKGVCEDASTAIRGFRKATPLTCKGAQSPSDSDASLAQTKDSFTRFENAAVPPSGGPSPTDDDIALFDKACVNVGAALTTNTEAARQVEVIQGITICNQHPRKEVCEDASTLIKSVRKATPLTCTAQSAVSAEAQAKDALARFESTAARPSFVPSAEESNVVLFDNACVNAAAAIIGDNKTAELPQWIATCERHPRKQACENTNDMIRTYKGITPLKCG